MAIELEMLYLLQAAVMPDTVVTLVVPPDPTAFDYASGILQILVLVVGLFALAAAALMALAVRRSIVALQSTVDRLTSDTKPLLLQASRLTEDAHDIVKTVRREVDKLADATGEISDRLLDVSDAAEQRIDDVNALLTVLQDQVQDTTLSAVAAVKGLRVSAAGIGQALTGGTPQSVSRRMSMRAARIKARREAQPLFDDDPELEELADEDDADSSAETVGALSAEFDDGLDDAADIEQSFDDEVEDDEVNDDDDDEHRPYYATDDASDEDEEEHPRLRGRGTRTPRSR